MPVKRFGVLAGRFFGSEVLTDWTVTSTSMNLFMWFKLEELATHIPVPLLFRVDSGRSAKSLQDEVRHERQEIRAVAATN